MNSLSSPRGRTRRAAELGTLCAVLLVAAEVQASHIPTALDVAAFRTPMKNEGYLMYATNPAQGVGRFGEEWTGWVDIRHPSLAGATDTNFGFDRSDRRFDVQSTILTDSTGAVAPANRVTDFNYANKAYMLQAGVSIIEIRNRGIASGPGGAGNPPMFTFPLTAADRVAISTFHNAGAPTVDLYYGRNAAGLLGATRIPTNGNPYIFLDNLPPQTGFPDTFAHEMYHFAGDGQATHLPLGGDPGHSSDPRNIVANGATQWSPGMPQNQLGGGQPPFAINQNISVMGPIMSTGGGGAPNVGGIDQLTTAQANRIFNAAAVAPFLQTSDNHAAGHRVDWDFVVDHNQFANDHDNDNTTAAVNFGLEGTSADNHSGVESLYWTIGATVASPQAGKNKTGLGTFAATPDYAGASFRTADVFSLGLNYSDSDVDANGTLSLRENALDYSLFFELLNGSIVAGIPQAVFVGGWTGNSFADDYLARWISPGQAKGVYIFALNTGGHDGVTQIDAVIVSAIPEPTTLALLTIGLIGMVAMNRKR